MLNINNLEYCDLLIFSVLLNAIMYWFLSKQKGRQSRMTRLFQWFVASIAIVGLFETLAWIIAVPGQSALIPLHYISNVLFFATNIIPASLGLLYLHHTISLSKGRSLKPLFLFLVPVYLNLSFLVVNAFVDGFLFSIDAENVYHRGIAAYIGNGFTFLFALAVIVGFYRNRHMITGRITEVMLVLVLLPVSGVALQMLFYGLSLGIPAYTLAVFITFLLMERHELQKDPLTLLHSRSQMENRLQFKLKQGEPFTAIMIDVNGFKSINDIHGHAIGDQVLKDLSKVLLSNANYEDFVCRYGGDEFFVILESPRDIGQNYIRRIEQTLVNYSSGKPYSAALSYGIVYVDGKILFDVDGLVRVTDRLMYEDKTNKKCS